MVQTKKVGILLFHDVEVLDFAGPFEVFSLAGRDSNLHPFEVCILSENNPVTARNNLSLNPHYNLENAPPLDILLVPGGPGVRQEINNKYLVKWITKTALETELILSVCTGSWLLAKAGLVTGMKLTTHHLAMEGLRKLAPENELVTGERFVDNGKIICSAGVASGIDMSFYVVAKLMGEKISRETASYMEYPWPLD